MLTPELREDIIRELRKFRSPSKVAKNLGLDIRLILPIADELSAAPRVVRSEQFDGMGRPELAPYIVGRKKAWDRWDNQDPLIAQARADYEAGTHDMITGRDGDWLILYSIPVLKKKPRPNYFTPEV